MSRVGSVPILVPNNVIVNNNNERVEIKYESQSKIMFIPKNIKFSLEKNLIKLQYVGLRSDSTKDWGTFRQNLNNAIKGFTEGFSKRVSLVGTGFKAEIKNDIIRLYLGHSHSLHYRLLPGFKAVYDKTLNSITVTGNDKVALGNFVRNMMNFRKVEPYKGKGVRLDGQFILRKESKTKK